MKALKVFTTVFAVLSLLAIIVAPALAESIPMQKRKLLVTAYYSPLPDQSFYIKGSYAADIRLNGRGTNGADGTEVYVGMLAAPKTYPFGTRVNIPGLGVGEVHDRGGAILAHKDYDRIDVWMGHGEEGLARALNWGARIVHGEVYFTPHQVQPGLSFSWVSSQLPASMVARLQARTQANKQANPAAFVKDSKASPTSIPPAVVTPTPSPEPTPAPVVEEVEKENKEITRLEQNLVLLASGLGKDASGEGVQNLQRMLWDLGYYKGEITGHYDQATIDAVFQFQIESGIINSEWDKGAGYFGKRTFEALRAAVDKKIKVIANYPKEVQVWVPAKKILPGIANLEVNFEPKERQELNFGSILSNKKIVQSAGLSSELDLNDRSEQVVVLQDFLIQHNYLTSGLNTGYYGQKTQEAVLKFQMEQGIVDSPFEPGAGRIGPKTLATINSF